MNAIRLKLAPLRTERLHSDAANRLFFHSERHAVELSNSTRNVLVTDTKKSHATIALA